MVECEECGREFKNKRGLKIHKAKKHREENTEKDEKTVQVCPECGSPRLEYASMDTRATGTITGLGAPEVYYCEDCGYEGSIKLEMPVSQLDKPQIEKLKERKTKKETKEGKKKSDVLKPIFTTVILLFLVAAVLTMIRGRVTRTGEAGAFNQSGYPMIQSGSLNLSNQSQVNLSTQEQVITEGGPGNFTQLEKVSRGVGLEESVGLFFPMFMVFLFIGLFVYMIWMYGYRIEHFK